MILTIVLLPLVAGCLALLMPWRNLRRALFVLTAFAHLGISIAMYWIPQIPSLGNWLVLDPLGHIFLLAISLLFALASIYTLGYLQHQTHGQTSSERVFFACLLFFLCTMSLVTMSHHLGLLWIAIEATTLASAPLIYFHRSASSLEATWKYLVICSVGIALALLGTVFLVVSSFYDGQTVSLLLSEMLTAAPRLHPIWLEASFLLFLVGYGTKMGLAPLHTWLPDAHSEAPAPVSALFSGVLLNCAFLGLLRVYQIFIAAGHAAFAQDLFLFFGLLSMLVAAVFILFQSDYKRMLAYSSVEHMGILAFAVGLGATAAFPMLLHVLNHSATKALLFFTAGNILITYQTKNIIQVRGILRILPITGFFWLAGFFAITGMPPFGTFISEFNILGVAIKQSSFLLAGLYLFFLAVIFIGMVRIFFSMAYGHSTAPDNASKENWLRLIAPLCLFVIILVLGLYLPDWFRDMLQSGVQELLGDH